MKKVPQITAGAIYVVLFLFALWASLRQRRAETIAHSVAWGSVSIYVLLWFLVWFLRGIYRRLAALAETEAAGSPKWKQQDRLITAVAVAMLVFSGLLLYRSFSFADPLRAAREATVSFWSSVFFIFWYPFGTASLIARVWHTYGNGKETS